MQMISFLLLLLLSVILVTSGSQDASNLTELEGKNPLSHPEGPCENFIQEYFPEATQKLRDIAKNESKNKATNDGFCGRRYHLPDDRSVKVVCKKMSNARGVRVGQGLCYKFLTNNPEEINRTRFNVHRKIDVNKFQDHGCASYFHDDNSAAVVACAFQNPLY